MSQESVLTLFVVIAALAFVVQAGMMVGVFLAVRNVPGQIEEIRREVKQRLDPLAQSVGEIVTASRDPIQRIATNFADISSILRQRAGQADAVMAELLDKTRLQIIRVDQLVSSLVNRVDSTADTVERSVLAPVREVSALVTGVRTGLEFLFTRRRATNVSEATQDEELFI